MHVNVGKQTIDLRCAACGAITNVDMRSKLSTFILRYPPPPSSSKATTNKPPKAAASASEKKTEDLSTLGDDSKLGTMVFDFVFKLTSY